MRIVTHDPCNVQTAANPSTRDWSRVGWISLVFVFCALNGVFWMGVAALVCVLFGLSKAPAMLFAVWLVTACLTTIAALGISTKPRVRHQTAAAPVAEAEATSSTAASDDLREVPVTSPTTRRRAR